MPNDGPSAYDRLQDQVNFEVQRAHDYIDNTVEAFKDTVDMILGAALTASRDYDILMKAEARKSLVGEILAGVLITLLPSLKIFETAALTPGLKIGQLSLKAVKVLEEKLDDLTNDFIDPLSEQDEKEENITQQQQIGAAANQTIKDELGKLYDLSQKVTKTAKKARKYIRKKNRDFLDGTDKNISLLPQIKEDFKKAGIAGNRAIGKNEFLQLSDTILYDMLRKYVETYVVFWIVDRPRNDMNVMEGMQARSDWAALRSRRIADLPQYREDWFITGIDLAKRNAIYGKFKYGVPGDPKRPGVSDYKDMIRYWNASTVNSSKAKIVLQ